MQTLLIVMRRMVTQVTGEQIKDAAHIAVRRRKYILSIQARMMVIGYPGGNKQTDNHRHHKQ